MSRLSNQALSELAVDKLRYERHSHGCGIVHLGVGAFFRAHQAWYTEQVLNQFGGDWGIVGASLRSADAAEKLNPQDGLYTILCNAGDSQNAQVIGALKSVITARQDPGELIHCLSDPQVKVVTLTITEKGYLYDPVNEALDWEDPGLLSDLENFELEQPQTAIAFLVAALKRRKEQDAAITLLSCDNLPSNGEVLEAAVHSFARRIDDELSQWIKQRVTFPCSMVDRIVPATSDKDLSDARNILGMDDLAVVATEPFSQWVIEEKFATTIPPWDKVGAWYVKDVKPFEEMKLRLLNGSHSLIAYLGYLAGFDYVHQVVAEPLFQRLLKIYMDDVVTPSLDLPPAFELDGYKEQLLIRFGNKSLNHRTAQIAQDGSKKIPQRWLAIFDEEQVDETTLRLVSFFVAVWIRYLQQRRDNGDKFEVIDPMEEELIHLAQEVGDEGEGVDRILALSAIFSNIKEQIPEFSPAVTNWYRAVKQHGVLNALKQCVDKSELTG